MRAIISDIHSNIEALQAVLADIERQGIEEIFCLGDIVGYGPSPEACIDLAMKWPVCLMGNHDEAVGTSAFGFNPVAREAIEWTRHRLSPHWYSGPGGRHRWQFLCTLPMTHRIDTLLFVHASPRFPTSEYILESDTAAALGEPSAKLVEVFGMIQGPCFVGHTHLPGIIEEPGECFLIPADFDGRYEYTADRKAIINVGSVGQPRDRDPRASYATMDDEAVYFHRVEYNVEKTARDIIESPGLPDYGGERLHLGR